MKSVIWNHPCYFFYYFWYKNFFKKQVKFAHEDGRKWFNLLHLFCKITSDKMYWFQISSNVNDSPGGWNLESQQHKKQSSFWVSHNIHVIVVCSSPHRPFPRQPFWHEIGSSTQVLSVILIKDPFGSNSSGCWLLLLH